MIIWNQHSLVAALDFSSTFFFFLQRVMSHFYVAFLLMGIQISALKKTFHTPLTPLPSALSSLFKEVS
jgi:hypothetical protein